MKPILVIQYPDGREDSYPVDSPVLTIGSDSSCDVAVQEPGIPSRLFRLRETDGRLLVERLVEDVSLSLDGRAMAKVEPFPVGGEIRCEGIRFLLRPAPPPLTAAGTESPDGTASQTDRIRAELGAGWRGYRRILSWLSTAVSPTEAERAESVFRSRRRFFLACLSLAALLLAAIVGAETLGRFAAVPVLRRFLVLFVLLSSVALRARGQIAFAGRALFLAAVPAFFVDPPDGPAAEADILLDVWEPAGILCAFLAAGWAVDFGAAVFRPGKRRRALRWVAMVLATAFAGFAELLFSGDAEKTAAMGWALSLLPLAALAPAVLPAARRWLGGSVEIADVENVVEVAFSREAKTIGGRGLALVGVSGVALLLLLALNARESMDWRSRRNALIVDTESGERPWFWKETRSFLEKADFDRINAFFLSEADLLAPASDDAGAGSEDENEDTYRNVLLWRARTARLRRLCREWIDARAGRPAEELDAEWSATAEPAFRAETDRLALTPLGERVGALLDEIDDNPDDDAPYQALLRELAAFRKTAADADWIETHLGTDVIAVNASEEDIRPSARHPRGRTYHRARPRLNALTQDPEAIDLASFRTQASLFPCLVTVILAFLFLWSRGGDSGIGLWIGIYLVSVAFTVLNVDFSYAFGDSRTTELADVGENLTRHALLSFHAMSETSVFGAIALFLLQLVYGGAYLFVLFAAVAQPILFVLVCWPTPESGSRTLVWTKRVLKFLAAGLVPGAVAFIVTLLGANPFVARLTAVLTLISAGFALRLRTRSRSEVPFLGWEFALAWLLIEAAVFLVTVGFSLNAGFLRPLAVPIRLAGWTTTPSFLLCAAVSAFAALLCFRMCLRRGFLQMLTPGRLAFAVFAVAIPCLAELSEQLVENVFEGSVLSSRIGDEMLGVLVVVLLFAPCWNLLCNRLRRFSVKQLPKVERSAERALEALLDEDPSLDFRDALHAAFAAIPLRRYAFYARTSSRSFSLVASRDAPASIPSSFEASRHLQRRLVKERSAVDFSTIAYERSMFFQSFELQRIGSALVGGSGRPPSGVVLPIRLGHSLRGILYAPADGDAGMPELSNEDVSRAVNDLGLATIASSRGGREED